MPLTFGLRDHVFVDDAALHGLRGALGCVGADQAITLSYEIMSDRLKEMLRLSQAGDLAGVAARCDSVDAMGRAVAMTSVCAVAGDAGQCARRGELAALAAVLSRLGRVLDRSIMQLLDL